MNCYICGEPVTSEHGAMCDSCIEKRKNRPATVPAHEGQPYMWLMLVVLLALLGFINQELLFPRPSQAPIETEPVIVSQPVEQEVIEAIASEIEMPEEMPVVRGVKPPAPPPGMYPEEEAILTPQPAPPVIQPVVKPIKMQVKPAPKQPEQATTASPSHSIGMARLAARDRRAQELHDKAMKHKTKKHFNFTADERARYHLDWASKYNQSVKQLAEQKAQQEIEKEKERRSKR